MRALAVFLFVCACAAPAAAQSEIPSGKFGLTSGLRQNTGSLGNSYGFGWLIGVGAGYQPRGFGSTYDFGASWEVMWGQFGADDPELVTESLSILEMSFALRLRRTISDSVPRFLAASAGVSLLRTNVPIPPEMDRLYIGPYAGLGIDQYVANRYLVGLEARYGMITAGPSSLSLMATVAFGSP